VHYDDVEKANIISRFTHVIDLLVVWK